jgi:glycosyltransferase involved in cell wall biosynthesis
LFTDSFHEVNGVALTSREFVDFARRQALPLLSVHAGRRNWSMREGSVATVEFERGRLRWNLEHDLSFDWLFMAHKRRLAAALREFEPDLVHITGPGDAGILGAMLAYELHVPLAASWHTNLHEFAGRRLARKLTLAPEAFRARAAGWTELAVLNRCVRFYRLAKVVFAPNPELVEMLAERTRRPAFLMQRGVDLDLFTPSRRIRTGTEFLIGYAGRLSTEKNVRLLADLEKSLMQAGLRNYRFVVIGEGAERAWLASTLLRRYMPGVLRGRDLARAYADMDMFVFPSETDTFGNVVLEALASGVPCVASDRGGPRFLIDHERTGYVVAGLDGFTAAVLDLHKHPGKRSAMRHAARRSAQRYSWDAVFEDVYRRYDRCFAAAAGSAETCATMVGRGNPHEQLWQSGAGYGRGQRNRTSGQLGATW